MTPIVWLAAALVVGAAAAAIGWPVVTASRERAQRDLNAERYLAWRGRASRGATRTADRMTPDERRRAWIASALALAALACILAFFVVS